MNTRFEKSKVRHLVVFFRLGVVLQIKIKSTKCWTWLFFRPAVVFDELSCSTKGFSTRSRASGEIKFCFCCSLDNRRVSRRKFPQICPHISLFFSPSKEGKIEDKEVWGISETHDQNYPSNARPRLRLADLLSEVVILQLRRGSES